MRLSRTNTYDGPHLMSHQSNPVSSTDTNGASNGMRRSAIVARSNRDGDNTSAHRYLS